MTSSEIFSKCLPRTQSTSIGVGGMPELTWEDVLGTLQGIKPHHEGFIWYAYLSAGLEEHCPVLVKARANFFAGLMTEACNRPDIQHWILQNPKQIENLVRMAVEEWRHSRNKYTDEVRAHIYRSDYDDSVKLHTWVRRYKATYSTVVGMPAYWEDIVLQEVRKRLK